VAYLRGNFWSGLRVTDLAALNRQARHWLATVANVRVHGTTGETPVSRLPQEALAPVAGMPAYDTSVVSYRWSSADCCISYDGNYYSVPLAFARQHLLVRETEGAEVVVLSPTGDELARHRLARGLNQRIIDPDHVAALTRPARTRPAEGASAPPVRVAARGAASWLPDAPAVDVRPLTEYDRLTGVRP
jgi:hypothetical protein